MWGWNCRTCKAASPSCRHRHAADTARPGPRAGGRSAALRAAGAAGPARPARRRKPAVNGPGELRLAPALPWTLPRRPRCAAACNWRATSCGCSPTCRRCRLRAAARLHPQGVVLRSLQRPAAGRRHQLDGSLGADGTLRLNGRAAPPPRRCAARRSQPGCRPAGQGCAARRPGAARWRGPRASRTAAAEQPGRHADRAAGAAGQAGGGHTAAAAAAAVGATRSGREGARQPAVRTGRPAEGAVPARRFPTQSHGCSAAAWRCATPAAAAGQWRAGGAEPGGRGWMSMRGWRWSNAKARAGEPRRRRLPAAERCSCAPDLRSGSRFLSHAGRRADPPGRRRRNAGGKPACGRPGWPATWNTGRRAPAHGAGPGAGAAVALALPASQVAAVEGLLDQPPASVPALDIEVDDFELRGRRLGGCSCWRSTAPATGRRPGSANGGWTGSTWTCPKPSSTASGRWAAGAGRAARMALDFKLDVARRRRAARTPGLRPGAARRQGPHAGPAVLGRLAAGAGLPSLVARCGWRWSAASSCRSTPARRGCWAC